MSTRKPCSVTSKGNNRKGTRCDGNDDESIARVLTSLANDRDGRKFLRAMFRPRRETNWMLVLQAVWIGISFIAGLIETGNGAIAAGYAAYNFIFLLYAILLSIIPILGIFTLVYAGNVQAMLASTFSVNLSNPWISFFVNGLYIVLGWIIQVVALIFIAIIIISIVVTIKK